MLNPLVALLFYLAVGVLVIRFGRSSYARPERYNGGIRTCPERIGQGDCFAVCLCFGFSAVFWLSQPE